MHMESKRNQKEYIKNEEKSVHNFTLNYSEFLDFFIKSYNNTNLYQDAQKICSDMNHMIQIIEIVYLHVEDRSIKVRLTRLKNKLNSQTKCYSAEEKNTENDTDYTRTDSDSEVFTK